MEHAFPLYTLADAVRLKEHILERWEAADKDPDLIGDGALNIVVVGGGPTGVESAGAIAELYRAIFVKDYPDIPQEKAQIVLVEAGPEIFTMFKMHLRKYAEKALSGRDVEVACGEVVESVTATRVTLKSGRVIPAHTLVWGAGLQANPIATSLGLKLEKGNRIPTQPDLQRRRPSGGVRGGGRRVDHRHQDRRDSPSARLGCAAVRASRWPEHRQAAGRVHDGAVQVLRQGHDGDHRPRRRGHARTARAESGRVWVAGFGIPHVWLLCGTDTAACPPGSSTGTILSPWFGFQSAAFQHFTSVQLDQSGNAWLSNNWSQLVPPVGGVGIAEIVGVATPVCTPLTPLPVRPSAASTTACPPQTAVHLAATPTPASAANRTAAASASQSIGPSSWHWAVIAAALAVLAGRSRALPPAASR